MELVRGSAKMKFINKSPMHLKLQQPSSTWTTCQYNTTTQSESKTRQPFLGPPVGYMARDTTRLPESIWAVTTVVYLYNVIDGWLLCLMVDVYCFTAHCRMNLRNLPKYQVSLDPDPREGNLPRSRIFGYHLHADTSSLSLLTLHHGLMDAYDAYG